MRNKGFFQVPNIILELDNLDIYQKMVLICLIRTGNQGAPIFPSYETIARRCSISSRKAKSTVKGLERLGLVDVTRRKKKGGNNTNLYRINETAINLLFDAQKRKESEINFKNTKAGEYGAPGGVQGAPPVVNAVHPIKNPDKELIKKNHIKGNTGKPDSRPSLSFDDYLMAYKHSSGTLETDMIRYYLDSYRSVLGKEHKKMKPGVWDKAERQILKVYSMERGEPEYMGSEGFDEIKVLIDLYFKKLEKFQKPCDYCIPHFNSPGVKAILYHECLYC